MTNGILDSGQKIVTNGLVLNLDAAQLRSYPTTGTTWSDLSGNNNNGTLVNGPTFNSGNGGSIVFDGVNDYVDVLSSATYKVQFPLSISVWFKLSTLPSIIFTLIETDNPTNSFHAGVTLTIGPTSYAITYGNNTQNIASGRRTYSASFSFATNQWYNLLIILPTNLLANSYVNANQISIPYVSGTTTTLAYSSSPMSIGFSNDVTPKYFLNGNVAQAQIYNRELSSQEVLQNYNATKSRYGL